MAEREVLLKVEHLEQFFKLGKKQLRAVDDINFEIYKGEVFGLVGESGCGKTTTGRTIIRLYKATGGSVYFKGQRIGAGTRTYREAIKNARKTYADKIKLLQKQLKASLSEAAESKTQQLDEQYKKEAAALKKERDAVLAEQSRNIKSALHDQKYCNRDYSRIQVKKVTDEYLPRLESISNQEEKTKIEAEYKANLRLAKKDRITSKIQMIFQDPIASLNPRMTVREIIAEGMIIRGIRDKKIINEQVAKVLEMVGLVGDHANRYPHEFSGGQRQRIGIARSIVLHPELIIADEPVSALDVSIQAQVINLLNDLRKELGLTILFIAHDLSVVKYFSDRIAVMYFGKIVELASSDDLFKYPLHPYTRSLLSAIPLPDPKTERIRQRIVYNPIAEHDYSTDKPSLREVRPGHFVSCNDAEYQQITAQLKKAEANV